MGVGMAPAVAQAHYLVRSGTTCELVGNVPTISAGASFESFDSNNKPIGGVLEVDDTVVETISGFTFPGSNGTWNSAQHPVTAGSHHVSGSFTWPNQNGQNGRFDSDVTCPAPATPPTPPSPESGPTPAPPPAPQRAVAGETESGPCVPKKLGRYRITVTPKGATHGLVTFHLKGRGASRIRWYVDTRRAGVSGQKWEWLRQHGRAYSVYLWAQERWGEKLWGRHPIEARFRVKNSCGKARAVHVERTYFNHDPPVAH
jgi:hypothetical protein